MQIESFFQRDNQAFTDENAKLNFLLSCCGKHGSVTEDIPMVTNNSAHHWLSITLRSHVEIGLRLAVNGTNTVRAVAIRNAMLPNA